jgi:hypothetical protein
MADFPSNVSPARKVDDIKANDAIRPTSRRFTMGVYPVKAYTSLSGKTVRRSFGNKASGYTLELTFENVDEGVLNTIFDHYHGQYGSTEGFRIPRELFSGYKKDATFDNFRTIPNVQWFYADSPQVESTVLALSTISITFIGDLV